MRKSSPRYHYRFDPGRHYSLWYKDRQSVRQRSRRSDHSRQDKSPPLPHSGRRQSNLSLTEPINHAVVNTSSVKISGKTLPASAIAIGEADDALLTADGDGNFTTDFKLSGGEI